MKTEELREILIEFAYYCNSFNRENNNIYEEDVDEFLKERETKTNSL